MDKVLARLIEKNETICFAESITGGILASTLISLSNASKVIEESYVLYSNQAKQKVLNLSKKTLQKYGVVSREVAYEMAEKLSKKTNHDVCVATTGYAEGMKKNHAFIAISYKNIIKTHEIEFGLEENRIKNINKCLNEAIKIIVETIA